jgi:hypothetical protein
MHPFRQVSLAPYRAGETLICGLFTCEPEWLSLHACSSTPMPASNPIPACLTPIPVAPPCTQYKTTTPAGSSASSRHDRTHARNISRGSRYEILAILKTISPRAAGTVQNRSGFIPVFGTLRVSDTLHSHALQHCRTGLPFSGLQKIQQHKHFLVPQLLRPLHIALRLLY